jgi:ribosomal protein L37AE/L43A
MSILEGLFNKNIEFRPLYEYTCSDCGEERTTLIKDRARVGHCMKCKRKVKGGPVPGQMSILGEE